MSENKLSTEDKIKLFILIAVAVFCAVGVGATSYQSWGWIGGILGGIAGLIGGAFVVATGMD